MPGERVPADELPVRVREIDEFVGLELAARDRRV
jgi:hypothetical protein